MKLKVTVNITKNKTGKPKAFGTARYRDMIFEYTVNPMVKGKYRYCGYVTILAPTGKEKKARGKDGKQIRKAFYLESLSEATVEQAVKKAVTQLYKDVKKELQPYYGRLPARELSSIEALGRWGNGYLSATAGKATEKTRKSYGSILSSLCMQLPESKPIWEINEKDIAKLKVNKRVKNQDSGENELKARKADKKALGLLCGFYDYCLERTGYSYQNPIRLYLSKQPVDAKNPKNLIDQALRRYNLIFEEERRLNQEIDQNISDGRYMAPVLINGCGVELEAVASVLWRDIIFVENNPDLVLICQVRGRETATHIYVHPVFLDAARSLHKRYEYLVEVMGFSPLELEKMPVLSTKEKPEKPMPKNQITPFIRELLLSIGISARCLAENRDGKAGGGPMLLKRNYDHRLDTCGMKDDSGIKSYMKHGALRDTTSDHYRSFLDDYAQEQMFLYLRRYNFMDETISVDLPQADTVSENGVTRLAFPNSGPSQVLQCSGTIRLPAGARIEVRSQAGIAGELKIGKIKEDGTTKRLGKVTQLEF